MTSYEYGFEFAEIFNFEGPSMLLATAENLFCAMGDCKKFGYLLKGTAANLVLSMGHCTERSFTVKICDDFSAMGHRAGFGYALCGTAGFGHELWAIVLNQLPHH